MARSPSDEPGTGPSATFRLDEGLGFWILTFGSLVMAGLAVAALRRIDWI